MNVGLRKALDLFANVRPVVNLPGVVSRFENVDLVIVRENTEDLYSGPGARSGARRRRGIEDHHRPCFGTNRRLRLPDTRKKRRPQQDHAIHKANIMKLVDGLFLRCCRSVAEQFHEIEYKELIVDNACMQIVINPDQFDILSQSLR